MTKLDLSAPWETYVSKVKTLFERDSEIHIDYNDEEKILTLHVYNAEKAEAICRLLPTEKVFGNVVLKIQVLPASLLTNTRLEDFKIAFKNNPIVDDIVETKLTPFTLGAVYILFAKEVVQFFNDDLSDYNGLCSTLYQDIANEVLGPIEGAYYCTNSE